jgi:hypothetical protein
MPAPIAIAAAAGLGSAAIGASSASKAAKAQSAAAQSDLALKSKIYDETTQRFQPFLEAGQLGQQAYMSELGLGDAPEGYEGYQSTPAYNFMMNQGVEDIESSAAARGKLFSGATGTALERFRTGLVSQEQNTFLNRLSGLSQQGQAAAGSQASAGQAYSSGAGQAYGNLGAARASGALGVGNAVTGGINTGLNLYGFLNDSNSGIKY